MNCFTGFAKQTWKTNPLLFAKAATQFFKDVFSVHKITSINEKILPQCKIPFAKQDWINGLISLLPKIGFRDALF